jgi:hypothetical protein
MKYHFMQKDRHLWRILLLVVFAVATVSVRADDKRTIKLIVSGKPMVIKLAEKPVITYSGNQLHITTATSSTPENVTVAQVEDIVIKSAPTRGDANGDEEIDGNDISPVANHIVGKTPTDFEPWGADFNGDGKIDALDITEIIKKIINKE